MTNGFYKELRTNFNFKDLEIDNYLINADGFYCKGNKYEGFEYYSVEVFAFDDDGNFLDVTDEMFDKAIKLFEEQYESEMVDNLEEVLVEW